MEDVDAERAIAHVCVEAIRAVLKKSPHEGGFTGESGDSSAAEGKFGLSGKLGGGGKKGGRTSFLVLGAVDPVGARVAFHIAQEVAKLI
jgi:hypothetical protein